MNITARATSIKTVARHAGVAYATVARVVQGKGYVSQATRLKVEQAIAATGYQPNAIARSLKANRSFVLGHLLQSTVPNPFFVQVAAGAEAQAHEMGYTVLTYNVQGDAEEEKRGVETFLAWKVDAIVFTTPVRASNVSMALAANIPVVQVERPLLPDSDALTVNNYTGARAAMEHLLALGHKRIAYVGQSLHTFHNTLADYVETQRYGAYQDAMRDAGLPVDKWVALGAAYTLHDTDAKGLGYRAAKRWNRHADAPTAVFAGSDMLAAGVYLAMYEDGRRIPQDVSVVGFDDTLAAYLTPQLTTVSLPARELGKCAAQLAVARLQPERFACPDIASFGSHLVIRNSTTQSPG
jgi:LacI family transcriptional regulator